VKLDPGAHKGMHSVLALKLGVIAFDKIEHEVILRILKQKGTHRNGLI
jgi:hypothetical protein